MQQLEALFGGGAGAAVVETARWLVAHFKKPSDEIAILRMEMSGLRQQNDETKKELIRERGARHALAQTVTEMQRAIGQLEGQLAAPASSSGERGRLDSSSKIRR